MKNMPNMQRNKEIGSEFWFDFEPKDIACNSQEILVLSGRTAIDVILKDILKSRKIRNVYLPAYCCDSMIDPFIRNGIDVKLYDIDFDGGLQYLIDEDTETDIFYVNNYFGYENTISNKIIEHFKHKGAIIIYDKTVAGCNYIAIAFSVSISVTDISCGILCPHITKNSSCIVTSFYARNIHIVTVKIISCIK